MVGEPRRRRPGDRVAPDLAVVIQLAEMVGAMQWAFDTTLDWAFNRYSFGRPLASYQEIKHRFADMKMWLEASYAITDAAARARRGRRAATARALVSAGKSYVGRYGAELIQDCVQLHGGIGVTFDHDLHLYLRRVTTDMPTYGSPAEHAGADLRGSSRRRRSVHDRPTGLRARRDRRRRELRRPGPGPVASSRQHAARPRRIERELRGPRSSDEEELARIARCRELQRMLFDGGLAGICVPREYGGQGLTPAHQAALNREIAGYDYPAETQIPTFTPCMAVILEFGTEEQKKRHVPPILKGEELWMQFLSEPSGGSDVAGAQTTAVRDGDEWVLNGSKIWTTGAWWADWGLCLARTNWDVPKHRGLTVFMVQIHQPGIEIHRIEMLNGSREFCQEFITDVRIPDTDRIGEVDQGWTVGIALDVPRAVSHAARPTSPARPTGPVRSTGTSSRGTGPSSWLGDWDGSTSPGARARSGRPIPWSWSVTR